MLENEENLDLDPSTMVHAFELCAKANAQVLQTSILNKTFIDELRSQIRSLQTQMSNMNSSMDEIENRIFIKLQGVQPSIYTREGIPIDDALDAINSKMKNNADKIASHSDRIDVFETEIHAKVDRDDILVMNQENERVSATVQELSMAMQSINKEMGRQKNEMDDKIDKIEHSLKMQIQRSSFKQGNDDIIGDKSLDFVTREELGEIISKLKLMGNEGRNDSTVGSSVVEYALSGNGVTEERVQSAFDMLQKKQAEIEAAYNNQKSHLDFELNRLMRVAEANKVEEEDNLDIADDWDYEEEEEIFEFRSVGVDFTDGVVDEETDTRPYGESYKRRSIGLMFDYDKQVKKTNEEEKTAIEAIEVGSSEVTVDPEVEVQKIEKVEKKSSGTKKQKGLEAKTKMNELINQMKEKKPVSIIQNVESRSSRVDEKRIIEKVIEAIMPKVENLMVNAFSSKNASGIKLEKHEARQLIDQLSMLEQIRSELKNTKTKIAQKADKIQLDEGLKCRFTRDEMFNLLAELIPDNKYLETLTRHHQSNLPVLKHNHEIVNIPQPQITLSKPHKQVDKGPLTLIPSRNPKMLHSNMKYLTGSDGKQYFRDMNSVVSQSSGNNPIIGGYDTNLSASYDFQPYLSMQKTNNHDNDKAKLGVRRERTPSELGN